MRRMLKYVLLIGIIWACVGWVVDTLTGRMLTYTPVFLVVGVVRGLWFGWRKP